MSGFIALSLCGVSLWLFWHRCLALYITLSLWVCRFGFIAFWLCRFIAFWCVALALSLSGVWLYRFIALWCVALAFWCLALSLYRFLVWLYRFLVSGFIALSLSGVALSLSGVWLYRFIAFWCVALSLYMAASLAITTTPDIYTCLHMYMPLNHLSRSVSPTLSLSLALSLSLSASPSLELCICFGSYIGRAVHASVQNEMVCSSLSLMLTYGSACPGRRSCRLMMHASIYSLLVFFLGAVQLV